MIGIYVYSVFNFEAFAEWIWICIDVLNVGALLIKKQNHQRFLMLPSDKLAAHHFAALRMITACHFRVETCSGHATLALSPNASFLNRIQLFAACPHGQSVGDYLFVGKMLLADWSFLCGKWRLSSCTNITIKVTMQRAASLSESNITNVNLCWSFPCCVPYP